MAGVEYLNNCRHHDKDQKQERIQHRWPAYISILCGKNLARARTHDVQVRSERVLRQEIVEAIFSIVLKEATRFEDTRHVRLADSFKSARPAGWHWVLGVGCAVSTRAGDNHK